MQRLPTGPHVYWQRQAGLFAARRCQHFFGFTGLHEKTGASAVLRPLSREFRQSKYKAALNALVAASVQ
jgi:hypothetical protein